MEEIKRRILEVADSMERDIIQLGKTIFQNPELGYKEEKTSKRFREILEELRIPYSYPHAVTGVLGCLDTGRAGVNVCVMGEMDAVTADRHSCGHHVQISTLAGVAMVLARSGVMNACAGKVSFLAAPAEEFTELAFRRELIEEGKIAYIGGKQQLIAEGVFDEIDMALMLHAHANTPECKLFLNGKSLGFMAKSMRFIGKEAHGSEPFNGINALNAAMMTLMGIHANRETFREEDKIRIHPIITQGGDIVNVIPSDVAMETYVRGASLGAIQDACEKVDRAVQGAALAVGAEFEIKNLSGYLPLRQDENLSQVMEQNAHLLATKGLIGEIVHGVDMTGSTDVGDLSHLIPVIQPTIGGYMGTLHSKNFRVYDGRVYTNSVKLIALTVADLICKDAALGKQIKQKFNAALTKEEYLNYLKNS